MPAVDVSPSLLPFDTSTDVTMIAALPIFILVTPHGLFGSIIAIVAFIAIWEAIEENVSEIKRGIVSLAATAAILVLNPPRGTPVWEVLLVGAFLYSILYWLTGILKSFSSWIRSRGRATPTAQKTAQTQCSSYKQSTTAREPFSASPPSATADPFQTAAPIDLPSNPLNGFVPRGTPNTKPLNRPNVSVLRAKSIPDLTPDENRSWKH